ncbi:MAG: hypothetical protein IH591_06295, partial [Bacteroidales bacterium]|nr:hypothetical protein [Bacteroidales bacterium]
CRLKHTELLDAAFDHNIIGINPDYEVLVRQDVLDEIDGPMLKYGLQSLNHNRLIPPRHREEWPDKDRLDHRFKEFLKAV